MVADKREFSFGTVIDEEVFTLLLNQTWSLLSPTI
jgi:hypothetical protein